MRRILLVAALAGLAGCGGGDGADDGMDAGGDADAGPDGGGFDVAAHLIAPEDAVASDIDVRVWCGVWGCDVPDGGSPWETGKQLIAEITAPTEGDYVADWDQLEYFIYASAAGFYTQYFPVVHEGDTYTLDLDRIPDYPSAVAGVIFATQSGYCSALVKDEAIHASGPGGIEFDFATDDQGRFGLHDLPPGDYTFHFAYNGGGFDIPVTSGPGLAYADFYFADPEQLD